MPMPAPACSPRICESRWLLFPAGLVLLLAASPALSKVEVSGSFHHDFAHYRLDGSTDSANLARRSRIALNARPTERIQLKLEWDFASGRATDVYAQLRQGAGQLRFGQFKQPVGLEQQGSSRDLPLLERSMVDDAFALGRRVGLQWSQPLAGNTLQVSAFGGDIERPSAAQGLALRLFSPPLQDGRLQLGLSLAGESRSNERVRLRARAESRLLPMTPLDTGLQPVERGTLRSGLEAAWIDGPLSLQGELIALRSEGGALSGEGATVTTSWTFGGEREFNRGAVDGPALESGRVFELSARASFVDFDLGATHLGRQSQVGLAGSVWLGQHLRLMLEHGQLRATRSPALPSVGETDARITSLRAQLSF